MLRNRRDLQSLVYLVAQPALVAWQWYGGFSWLLFALTMFLSVGVSVIHHNHAHLKMWHSRPLNRLTDFWLTILQGHPTFVFHVSHNSNHHRYHQGPGDVARTYRFGGDSNHLVGYVVHPIQAVWVLYPLFCDWMRRLRWRSPGAFHYCLLQYLAIALLWATLALVDWQKWLVFVLVPQLHGLHWLLATNYLQHAHTDGQSPVNFARNFEGLLNPLLFNIGFHTAHHCHAGAHWSELPLLHAQYRSLIDPRLNAGGLLSYMFKTFILSLAMPRLRSQSLMRPTDET